MPDKSGLLSLDDRDGPYFLSDRKDSNVLKPYPISTHDRDQILNRFTYHPPIADQIERYATIRSEAQALALKLSEMCPVSRELSLALTKLEECVMHANSAIARNEKA